MAKYHRLAHVSKIYKGTGSTVKRGEEIAEIGKPSNSTAHLHWDIFRTKPRSFTEYVQGYTKAAVEQKYENPRSYVANDIPIKFSHFGLEYLERNTKSNLWHTGYDMNGPGAGNADYGDVIKSPVDGKVVYVRNTKINDKWGGIVVIEESAPSINKVKDIATELADMKLSIAELEKRVADLEFTKTAQRMSDLSLG